MGGNTATEEAPPREEKTSDIVSGHFEVKRNKFVFCCSVCRKEVASEFEARAKRNMKDVHSEKFSIRSLEDFFSKRARPEDVAQGKCKLLPHGIRQKWECGTGGASGASKEVVEDVDDGAGREEYCMTLAVVDSGGDAAPRQRCRILPGAPRTIRGTLAVFVHPSGLWPHDGRLQPRSDGKQHERSMCRVSSTATRSR